MGNGNNFFLETGKKQHVREEGFLSKASGPHKRADVSCHMDKTASRWSEEKNEGPQSQSGVAGEETYDTPEFRSCISADNHQKQQGT